MYADKGVLILTFSLPRQRKFSFTHPWECSLHFSGDQQGDRWFAKPNMIIIFLNHTCSNFSFFPLIFTWFLFNQTSHIHELIKVSRRLLQRTIVIYKSTFSVKSKHNKVNFQCWLCYFKLVIVLPNPLVKRNPWRLWELFPCLFPGLHVTQVDEEVSFKFVKIFRRTIGLPYW